MKEMSISSGVIRLIITGMSVDGAVSEFPLGAKLIAVKHGWVFWKLNLIRQKMHCTGQESLKRWDGNGQNDSI